MFLEAGVERGNLGRPPLLVFLLLCCPSQKGLAFVSRYIDFLHVLTQWLKASGRDRQINTTNNEKYKIKVKQYLSCLHTGSSTDSHGVCTKAVAGEAFSKTVSGHWASRGLSRGLNFSSTATSSPFLCSLELPK